MSNDNFGGGHADGGLRAPIIRHGTARVIDSGSRYRTQEDVIAAFMDEGIACRFENEHTDRRLFCEGRFHEGGVIAP